MQASYNFYLVALSCFIAAYASYATLAISERLVNSEEKTKWLLGGSITLAAGIWSMHFIGMMAYEVEMPVSYSPGLTILSGVIVLISSALAMYLIGWHQLTLKRISLGGTVIGLGIASMHYVGMEAMVMPMEITYLPSLFIISIFIAISASIAALWIAHKLTSKNFKHHNYLMFAACLVMGIAIAGMHYVGMAAAIYTPALNTEISIDDFDNTILIGTIALITLLIITSSLIASRHTSESHTNDTILLVLTITTAVTISVGISIDILYNTAFQTTRTNLSRNLENHKDMIRAVTEFDALYSSDAIKGGARAATISQIRNSHSGHDRHAESEEFLLFEFSKDRKEIHFLINESALKDIFPYSLPASSHISKLFKKTLNANSGVIKTTHPISKEKIVAAYAYIPELKAGIISSVTIETIRKPFFRALAYTGFFSFFIILIAAFITIGISTPIINSLKNEITNRNKIENELRDMAENLESLVKERTIDLEQSLILTEDAIRAKSEFLANMSHEIRTPMNGVLGMLQLVIETKLDKDQSDFINTAYSSAETLLTILNDILDFSKIESGAIEIESIDFNLHDTIDDVASLLAESAHKKNLELLSHISTNVPVMIKSDPTRLRQILFNLTNNAIKFTHTGEVLIKVSLEKTSATNNRIKFEISDTGIGIAENAQRKIFEVFKQEDGSTTRKFGGTGLGLAISKKLSQNMGGDLDVNSSEGSGSTFYFSINTAVSKLKPEKERDFSVLSGMNMLIVDDNKTNRTILESMLRSWKINFESVDSGEVCLQTIKQPGKKFNVILLDMMMPNMNGIEVAETIKSDSNLKDLTIIMLTSLTQANIQEESKKSGISVCLHKPIKKSLLLDTIMSTVGHLDIDIKSNIEAVEKKYYSGIKILVAEDNTVNQKVISRMLTFLGFSHHITDNGKDAINELDDNDYSLILMDCQMPVMDGFEATKNIRSADKHCNLPIIAMTANAMEGDKERCINAGMSDYISKPLNKDTLFEILIKWTEADKQESIL